MKTLIIAIIFIYFASFGASAACGQQKLAADDEPLRPKVEFTTQEPRDPFNNTSIFEEENKSGESKTFLESEVVAPPELKIQGIVWGGRFPVAIINESVFKEGDVVGDSTIIRIQKEGVEVYYKGKNFLLPAPAQIKDNNP